MFFQKPSSYQPVEPKRRGDRLLRLVIALNVLVLIIAVAYVAWMPGAAGASAPHSQNRGKLASWAIPQVSAQSGDSRQSNLIAAKHEAAAPQAALLGGMTPTPGPTMLAVQPTIAQNVMGGTCISGYIIDVYHQPVTEGLEITARKDGESTAPITRRAGPDGTYRFDGLTAGTYTMELAIPEGFRAFTPATFKVTLSGEGDACAQTRFKLEALACLEVFKLDESGNLFGNGMIGIPGWKMNASSGQINLLQETNGDGRAYFRNLAPGQWTVQEETRNGWIPANGYSSNMMIDAPSPLVPHTCQPVVFVNKQVHTGCIAPKKLDTAGNGVSNWKFSLRYTEGTQETQYGTTDSSGIYYFQNLAMGQWIVKEELTQDDLKWWRPVGAIEQEIDLQQANNLCTQPIFTNEPLGAIEGYKINHLEEGMEGWVITAVNDKTGERFTDTSKFNGYFKLEGLPFGTYTVSENIDQHPGWEPVTAPSFKVVVSKQFVYEQVRFKNKTDKACVRVFKRDSYDNFGLAEWTIQLIPAFSNNPEDVIVKTTNGEGLAIFEGLTPGYWKVSEVDQDGWAPDDPAMFDQTFELKATGSCSTITLYNHQTNQKPAAIVPFDPRTPTAPGGPGGAPANNTCSQYYTIVRGDTLYRIADRFGVTVERLRVVNKISNPNLIHPNTKLCIPNQ